MVSRLTHFRYGVVATGTFGRLFLFLGAFCVVIVGVGYPTVAQSNEQLQAASGAEVATAWFDLQLKLVEETPGFTPPVAARAFGYTSVALYEAVAPGLSGYQTLAGQLNELTELPQPAVGTDYHWETVANSALASITRRLFPNASAENLAATEVLHTRFSEQFQADVAPEVFDRSVTQGRVIADAVYLWSLGDGGDAGYQQNFPEAYVPPLGDGMWVPTPRLNGGEPQPALQPYWGQNRPFVVDVNQECTVPPPPEYSVDPASYFYHEAMEVYEAVENLSSDQMEIAQFWADDPGATPTPPGHSISILTQVLRRENASFAMTVEAYAKVGIAISDAFIGCWNTKYRDNLVRPVTYINQVIDPDWMPPVNTPPFPEYTSGHSVQSGAAAQVMTDLFGDDYAFTDHTHDSRGYAPRTFASFFDFADEAAISRLYGGIHYRAAIEFGLEQGRCIGQQVSQLQLR